MYSGAACSGVCVSTVPQIGFCRIGSPMFRLYSMQDHLLQSCSFRKSHELSPLA